jgi:polysaccharide biosynthesis/export protein
MKIHEMQQFMRWGSNAICLAFVFSIYLSLGSCVPSKKFVYFHNLTKDSTYPADVVIENTTKFVDPVIEPNDILSITVQTLLQNESNAPVEGTSSPSAEPLRGFLVDKNGYVELSMIGFVKVGGLTTSEARELIKQKMDNFYIDPVVRVRISNFDVMVTGDVVRPGKINIPSEKATILDVLAEAGDLNVTGKRTNVLLKRMEGDKTRFVRLDLTSTDILKSPYLYVRQHDYIYVEHSNYKRQSSDNTFIRYLSYGSGLVGIVSLLFILKVIK